MYKKLFLIVVLLLLIPITLAAGVQIRHVPIRDTITPNEVAEIQLIIKSSTNEVKDYIIEPAPQFGNWRVSTPKPYIITLDINEEATSTITLTPLREQGLGIFNHQVIVKDRKGNIVGEYTFPVKIVPFSQDAITTEIVFPDDLEPGSPARIKVRLENRYNYDLENLDLSFKSSLFSQTRFINLKANEKRLEDFSFEIPKEAPVDRYFSTLRIITREGNVLAQREQSFNIQPKAAVTERDIRDENFLFNTLTIVKENKGTKASREKVVIKFSTLQRMFSSFSHEPDLIEKRADGYYLTWNFNLRPQKTVELTVTTDYRIFLFSLIVLILLVIIILIITRKKLTISKTTMEVKRDKEGINLLKISLHIKNRTSKKYEKLQVTEYLPNLLGITKHFGTLKPDKVLKDREGNTKIVWELDKLERGEERIISYVAKSQLSIIGKLFLPSAILSYKTEKGIRRSTSNKLTLISTPATE